LTHPADVYKVLIGNHISQICVLLRLCQKIVLLPVDFGLRQLISLTQMICDVAYAQIILSDLVIITKISPSR